MSLPEQLLAAHRLVSDQVSAEQVMTILRELETVLAAGVGGAIVEFGCYVGTTSLFIRRLLDKQGERRDFHVYDSFEGLPAKSRADDSPAGAQFQAGELSVSKKRLLQEFQKADLKPPIVHKGWFDELTMVDVPETIAFAFLDGDFYGSIRDSLRLVLPRMAAHGTIVIDDYAREALPGVAKAVRDVAPRLALKAVVRHNLGIIHV